MERLRQKTLELSCPSNKKLVFVGQFIHTHNCDNIHKLLVPLKYPLHLTGNRVMLLTEYFSGKYTACRLKRINCRINTLRRNSTLKELSLRQDVAKVVAGAGSVRSSAGT